MQKASVMIYAKLLLFLCGLTLVHSGHAQHQLEREVTLEVKDIAIKDLLKILEQQTGIRFMYGDLQQKIQNEKVTVEVTEKKLSEVLYSVLVPKGIEFVMGDENTIVLRVATVKKKDLTEATLQATGEKHRITGTVTDATNGQGVPGVNVLVKGTSIGTATDNGGKYEVIAADNNTLVFSFIGYKSTQVVVSAKAVVDVTLEAEVATLNEVVVNAGYYDVKQKEATGSIVKVTSDVIEKQPVTNPLGALQGRMAGVYIEQASGTPGAAFNIQIRGRNSLRNDGNEPLYIVDGVPFSTEKTFSNNVQGGFSRPEDGVSPVSPLASINTNDIESIEVLKDADATAIYGSRGANGVVLITTKKGKVGKTKFDLNVYSGIGTARTVPLLTTKQFVSLRKEGFANDGIIPSATPGAGYSPELMLWDTTRYTDWQKVFLSASHITSVQSSITGGSAQTQFLFGLGYKSESSVYSKEFGDFGYQKGSFTLSVTHASTNKRFFINAKVNGAKDQNKQPQYTLINIARQLAPNAPALYDENGELNWANSTWQNPLASAKQTYKNNVVYFTGNIITGYEIIKGLKFQTSFGLNYLDSDEITKAPHTRLDPALGYTSANSAVQAGNGTNQSWIIEPQLNYTTRVGEGTLSLLAGNTIQGQQLQRRADLYVGFPSDALIDNLGSASRVTNYEFIQSLYRYVAVFGRANYTWREKYIINLTMRRDGSSRFGPGKQYANFGAAGAAWIFSEEPIIKTYLSFLSFGKLRASYGITGSDQIGNYQYIDTYATSTSVNLNNQYQGVTFISPTKLFNADYAWEVNKKFEAALNLGFLNDAITFNVSYYRNRSSNQLVNYTLPKTTGFSGILANLPATVQNTGLEFELSTHNLKSKAVQWSTSLNVTVPKNKLVAFPNLESSTYANRYVIGHPLSIDKTFESTGVNPETGLWTFRDINGDGVISRPADNTQLIFLGQELYGGVNNTFTYKGWSLDIFFQFVKQTGVQVFANGYTSLGKDVNVPAFIANKRIWRKPGDDAEIQKVTTLRSTEATAYSQSDVTKGDASFIRLKNVSLAYTFPDIKGLKCRLYFQGQNLLLITKYQGDDPENRSFDYLAPLRMFTTGIQLTL